MKTQATIESKLTAKLSPSYLEVINESRNHNVPPGSESHFRVTIAATEFAGKSLVDRHRKIYEILQPEMQNGVHALALHVFTPDEWSARQKSPASPPCLGGDKKTPS